MARPAVLFDLDGVISDTASVHAKAWKTAFDMALSNLDQRCAPFTEPTDYIEHLDGKTRLAGIASFLSSRGIDLPTGQTCDTGFGTILGIGNSKNDIFRRLIAEHGVNIFGDAVRLIQKLRELNLELGLASSSKNARTVLERGGLIEAFRAIMDGVVAEERNIASKPDPAFYLYAAQLLGRSPEDCVVIEDAISGIVSAKAAGARTVIGAARNNNGSSLRGTGADIVVSSLDDLTLDVFLFDAT